MESNVLNRLSWLGWSPLSCQPPTACDRVSDIKLWLVATLTLGLTFTVGQQAARAMEQDAGQLSISPTSHPFEQPIEQPTAEVEVAFSPVPLYLPPAEQRPSFLDEPLNQTFPGDIDFQPPAIAQSPAADLDLDPEIIERSPVLQRWLQGTPDITHEISHQPSFRPRLRLSYARFPSTGGVGGFAVGVDDLFVWPGTGLTVSGDYSRGGGGLREDYGGEARYYLLPLGGYINLAPTVGYRALTTPTYSTDGLSLGLRLMVVPSRGGAADLAISHQWVALGSDREVGLTKFTLGYAVTHQLRLGTDLQFQNSRFGQDSRLGLSLEWLL